jgi:DNA polymerase III subunit delta'
MNWDILGHDWAVDMLREHIVTHNVRHAYLITGPPGVGRRTLALRMAQALNCLQPPAPGDRCGNCRSCLKIEQMQHPDLLVVQAETLGSVLKVEAVRELQHNLALTPYEARFKVALLLRFEESNLHTANALLKTLEEPAPQVVLILTAQSPDQLFPTIVSRCEVLRLRPLSPTVTKNLLHERWGYSNEQANLLAHISGGRPGLARRLVEDPALLEQRQLWLNELLKLMSASRTERFTYAEKVTKVERGSSTEKAVKEKTVFTKILPVWLSLWRDILLDVSQANIPAANPDLGDTISKISPQLTLPQTRRFMTRLLRTQELIDLNINQRLACEVLLLELPQLTNPTS